jgi:hypothetical protein
MISGAALARILRAWRPLRAPMPGRGMAQNSVERPPYTPSSEVSTTTAITTTA